MTNNTKMSVGIELNFADKFDVGAVCENNGIENPRIRLIVIVIFFIIFIRPEILNFILMGYWIVPVWFLYQYGKHIYLLPRIQS